MTSPEKADSLSLNFPGQFATLKKLPCNAQLHAGSTSKFVEIEAVSTSKEFFNLNHAPRATFKQLLAFVSTDLASAVKSLGYMTTYQMLSIYSKKLRPLLTHPASIIVGIWCWLPLGIGLLLTNNRLRKDYRWWGGVGVWIVILVFGGRWSSKPTTNLDNVETLTVLPADNTDGNTGQKKTTPASQSDQQDLVCGDVLKQLLRSNDYELYSSPASPSSILRLKASKRIRGSDLEWLATFQQIEVVDIPAKSIDPSYVMRLPNLRKLAINELAPEDVYRLATCCPGIENLSFAVPSKAKLSDYIAPLSELPSLTHLRVSGIRLRSDVDADVTWDSLSSLETLELRGTSYWLRDEREGAAVLRTLRHKNLRELYMPCGSTSGSPNDGWNDMLAGFSDRCPALNTLSVGRLLLYVVEFGLEDLTQCKNLSTLYGIISTSRRKADELRIRLRQQVGEVWNDLPPGSVPVLKLVSAAPTHQPCSVAEA